LTGDLTIIVAIKVLINNLGGDAAAFATQLEYRILQYTAVINSTQEYKQMGQLTTRAKVN
jgi:hypothetical protein